MSKPRKHTQAFDINNAIPAERAVIGHCLFKPERAREIAARVLAADFIDPFNRRIMETLVALADQDRIPSVEAVVALLGNDEVAPGVNVRNYLHQIGKEAILGGLLPWEGAVEVVLDHAHRRDARAIAEALANGAALATSIGPVLVEASEMIDDLQSTLRCRRRDSYGAADAGASALEYLDTPDRNHPTTGLEDLDAMLGGWPRSQLSILAGRPGMCKSAVATSAVLRAAKSGVCSLIFSLEMTKIQLGARMLTDLAYTHDRPIHYEDINRRKIDSDQRQRLDAATARLQDLPVKIEEERGLLLSDIGVRTRKHAAALAREGRTLQLVVVDHVGLVRPTARYAGNRVREVGELTDGLATLAKEMDLAIVGLCQLNRGVEGRDNKRPNLADLRDSGEVEEIASTVTFLYRPAYYLEQMKCESPGDEADRLAKLDKHRHDLELQVAKNRNGRIGHVRAFVDIGANAVRNASFAHR